MAVRPSSSSPTMPTWRKPPSGWSACETAASTTDRPTVPGPTSASPPPAHLPPRPAEVDGTVLAAAWYRFGATFRRRRGSYLAIVLLIALMGGLAMGSIAGARRTQSAFSAYLAATKASDLQFQTSIASYGLVDENLTKKLEQLPGVERVASAPNLLVSPSERNGKVILSAFNDADVQAVGSVGGMFFSNDRVTVAAGAMADPNSTHQIVSTAEAAHLNGWHVGETVYFDGYSVQEASSTTFNPLQTKPTIRV